MKLAAKEHRPGVSGRYRLVGALLGRGPGQLEQLGQACSRRREHDLFVGLNPPLARRQPDRPLVRTVVPADDLDRRVLSATHVRPAVRIRPASRDRRNDDNVLVTEEQFVDRPPSKMVGAAHDDATGSGRPGQVTRPESNERSVRRGRYEFLDLLTP
jgi:hypothetical protein